LAALPPIASSAVVADGVGQFVLAHLGAPWDIEFLSSLVELVLGRARLDPVRVGAALEAVDLLGLALRALTFRLDAILLALDPGIGLRLFAFGRRFGLLLGAGLLSLSGCLGARTVLLLLPELVLRLALALLLAAFAPQLVVSG